MKTTTTLNEYITSELYKSGMSEMYRDGKFIGFDTDGSYMNEILQYKPSVSKIIDNFFLGFKFNDENLDLFFKKAFTLNFQNREFKYQTPENVQSKLFFYVSTRQTEIETLFNSYEKMLTKTSESKTEVEGETNGDNRGMSSKFPDSVVNMDMNDTRMEFADTNTISQNRNKNKNNSHTQSTSYDPDAYLKFSGIWSKYFDEIDSECFLQTW